ncbi:MAG: Rrf2 family transcriptional regulator [Planctomycetaceae bacterium]|jgi:Rrf2 family transcriptional regulator, nitric oxide-sensitive transcriptional repressor|nr:Rrf2 family transcriptional regulator [Planctomycetaceae bacterium]MBT6157884.1 Rrf2 family transcriptional regulator [Planctomycetaceae bacterium]MBT6487409.1 Rrf2 family transcriptional regulator [Planctomycetaceae bacterium]MBT6495999.1 Rrf2 family transcriptional regulator [Planctomycetaceae bacterium]
MRLSLQTDYSLRTLIYLAHSGKRAKIDEIARFYNISTAHVAKVVHQLGRLGFIRSIRGVGGGVEMGRKPADISVGEVIRAVEGNVHLLECVGTEDVCIIERFCKLKGVFREAERIQNEYLDSVTIEDILPTRKQVRTIELKSLDG